MGKAAKKWESGLLKMKLVAEILTGSLFHVEVEEDATVGDLKRAIGEQENLPGDRLILLLDAPDDEERYAMDDDEVSLKDYGVEDSSHIYIFFQYADSIDSPASPSSPKDPPSSEPSHSVDSPSAPTDNKDDEPPPQENPSAEAHEPSASVDEEE